MNEIETAGRQEVRTAQEFNVEDHEPSLLDQINGAHAGGLDEEDRSVLKNVQHHQRILEAKDAAALTVGKEEL